MAICCLCVYFQVCLHVWVCAHNHRVVSELTLEHMVCGFQVCVHV